jgi:hypothetical protein
MSRAGHRRRLLRRLVAASVACAALSLTACGEKDEPDLSTVTVPAETTTVPTTTEPTPTTPPPTPQGGTGTKTAP